MGYKPLFAMTCTVFLSIGTAAVRAGETINDTGILVCATDKWDEKEVQKGHKLVDATSRCVLIPDEATAKKVTEACAGKYEYQPDGSWKAKGTCTDSYPGGDKIFLNWEEGSHLKEYPYVKTGGTGKYQGVSGGGTYFYENLTDTLSAGRYNGKIVLP
ncbi:hypothetical protein [Hyphomicrobium sp.]|jgi:hypothetical protein|uniref:hypothetical protein n=1 Tax=Hyphomicrobium sp. TaxID=82 RepID=UPI00356B1059